MAFIRPEDQERLRTRFDQELEHDVRLVLFVQPPSGLYLPGREEPQTGRETRALMEELASLSPRLKLEIHNPRAEPDLAAQYGIERSPALVILPGEDGASGQPSDLPQPVGAESDAGVTQPIQDGAPDSSGGMVRFFGLPSGYEFMTLLEDVVDVSRRATRLSEATRQAVAALPGSLHLQVFVTPT